MDSDNEYINEQNTNDIFDDDYNSDDESAAASTSKKRKQPPPATIKVNKKSKGNPTLIPNKGVIHEANKTIYTPELINLNIEKRHEDIIYFLTQNLDESRKFNESVPLKEFFSKVDAASFAIELKSLEFMRSVVRSTFPLHAFTLSDISKTEAHQDTLNITSILRSMLPPSYDSTVDPVLEMLKVIPCGISIMDTDVKIENGGIHLMWYQIVAIYLTIYGRRGNTGFRLSLSDAMLDSLRYADTPCLNRVVTTADVLLLSDRSQFKYGNVALNIPPGTGKTITAILTGAQACCDMMFQDEAVENFHQWGNPFVNSVPGSHCLVISSLLDDYLQGNCDLTILPIVLINVPNDPILIQWHTVISENLPEITEFAKQSIYMRYKKSVRVRITLFPQSPGGNVVIKLTDFKNFRAHNISVLENIDMSDDSPFFEIVYIVTKETTIGSLFNNNVDGSGKGKKDSTGPPKRKKRKGDESEETLYASSNVDMFEVRIDEAKAETVYIKKNHRKSLIKKALPPPPHKMQHCFVSVLINDEPQQSERKMVGSDSYMDVPAPLRLHLSASAHEAVSGKNTGFAKMLRGGTSVEPSKRYDLAERIYEERNMLAFLQGCSLFSHRLLDMACQEAASLGKMPHSVILVNMKSVSNGSNKLRVYAPGDYFHGHHNETLKREAIRNSNIFNASQIENSMVIQDFNVVEKAVKKLRDWFHIQPRSYEALKISGCLSTTGSKVPVKLRSGGFICCLNCNKNTNMEIDAFDSDASFSVLRNSTKWMLCSGCLSTGVCSSCYHLVQQHTNMHCFVCDKTSPIRSCNEIIKNSQEPQAAVTSVVSLPSTDIISIITPNKDIIGANISLDSFLADLVVKMKANDGLEYIDEDGSISEDDDNEQLQYEDLDFLENMTRDSRMMSESTFQSMKIAPNIMKKIRVERRLEVLKRRLNTIRDIPNLNSATKMYLTLYALSFAKFRHVVLLVDHFHEADHSQLVSLFKFLDKTPFKQFEKFINRRESRNVFDKYQKLPKNEHMLMVMRREDASIGVDFQNTDAVVSVSRLNVDALNLEQICGRLVRLGMDYRRRFIISYLLQGEDNLLSIMELLNL